MDWYPFYPSLYKSKTMHLDPYQDGCYRRLIDYYMETRQPLPDNDHALARIVGDNYDNWMAKARDVVRDFFVSKDGFLHHERCNTTLDAQDKKRRTLSESGKKGAEKRYNKINDVVSHPIAYPMASAIAEERRGEERREYITPLPPLKGGGNLDLPSGVSKELWDSFVLHRKEKKKPLTNQAAKQAIQKLKRLDESGFDAGKILAECIAHNWLSIYEPKNIEKFRKEEKLPSMQEILDEQAGKR